MLEQSTRYGSEEHYKAKRGDYKTPPGIYTPFLEYKKRTEFDFDLCCTDKNIPAKKYFTKKENGLIQPWDGLCFCNPPWDESPKWVKKGVAELAINPNLTVVYVLSSDKMYVGYVQDLFIKNPDCVFWILPKKQGFIIPGEEDKPLVPSVGVMMAVLSKQAGEIEYGLNTYNTYNTIVFKGEKPNGEVGQQKLFGN